MDKIINSKGCEIYNIGIALGERIDRKANSNRSNDVYNYNQYAERNGLPLIDTKAFDKLDENANDYEEQRKRMIDDAYRKVQRYYYGIQQEERERENKSLKEQVKAAGSNVAFAAKNANENFSPIEQASFRSELVFFLRLMAASNKIKPGEYIDKRKLQDLAATMSSFYARSLKYKKIALKSSWPEYISSIKDLADTYEISIDSLDTKEERDSITEEILDSIEDDEYGRQGRLNAERVFKSVQSLEDSISYIERLLGNYAEHEANPTVPLERSYIYDMIINNMSTFRTVFGKTFNPDKAIVFDQDDINNIDDNSEGTFDFEENVRERWMEELDSIDPSGSLSYVVNYVLSYVPEENIWGKTTTCYGLAFSQAQVDNVAFSDFFSTSPLESFEFNTPNGEAKIYMPLIAENTRDSARRLMKLLRNTTSISEMMKLLQSEKHGVFENIYKVLKKDPMLQTTFFSAFNKYFQKYTFTQEKGENINEIALNKKNRKDGALMLWQDINQPEKSRIGSSLFSEVTKNKNYKPGDGSNKYIVEIKFNDNYLQVLNNVLTKLAGNKTNLDDGIFTAFDDLETIDKVQIIENISAIFGKPLRGIGATLIARDLEASDKYLKNLAIVTNAINIYKSKGRTSKADIEQLLTKPTMGGKSNYVYEAIGILYNILNSVTDSTSEGFSDMASWKSEDGTKTIASNINMSHMSRFIKACNNYSKAELHAMLNRFANDSRFYDSETQRFKVRWLQDLDNYTRSNAKKGTPNNFGRILEMSRNLGYNTTSFEDVDKSEHFGEILSMYFNQLVEVNKSVTINTSNYPSIEEAIKSHNENSTDRNRIRTDTIVNIEGSGTSYNCIIKGDEITLKPVRRNTKCTLPTFLTGDTLALRGITSYHYSENEILDGIADFLDFDIDNFKNGHLLNKFGIVMRANDKEATITKNPDRFGFLSFLNKDYICKIKRDGVWIEETGFWYNQLKNCYDNEGNIDKEAFKNLINTFFNTKAEYYLEEVLNNLDLSEAQKSLLDKGPYGANQTHANMKDFLMNYYFSMYNQMAITSVSPSYYLNAKDINKRNKGGYTNGTPIVTTAIDPATNEPVWDNPNNPTQRVVYIYDIAKKLSNADKEMLEGIFGKNAKYIDDTYSANTLTDGQGWRSFESWRKIGLSLGLSVWSYEMESAYHKIQEISKEIYKLEADESKDNSAEINKKIQEIENLAVIYQPRKPINDSVEEWEYADGHKMLVPFQHKYAEIPIIPALFPKGSAMREMGRFMEQQHIDMMCSSKCGKRGVFGEVDLQYKTNSDGLYVDADGNVLDGQTNDGEIIKGKDKPTRAEQRRMKDFKKNAVENSGDNFKSMWDTLCDAFGLRNDDGTTNGIYDDLSEDDQVVKNIRLAQNEKATLDGNGNFNGKFYRPIIHESTLCDYLIQTNVPDHVLAMNNFGTQIRKIIIGGISTKENKITGEKKIYTVKVGNKTIQLNGKEYLSLYNALVSATFYHGFDEFNDETSTRADIVRELSNSIISNDRCDYSSLQKMADGVPLWEATLQHDAFSNIISMIRNRLIKQKINGGSVVQASALGSDMMNKTYLNDELRFGYDKNEGAYITQAIMPFNFSYTEANGEVVNLKYEDYCNTDGTFKTDEKGIYLIDKKIPGARDIIAYRIPTESEYSCFRLKVVRCCPKTGANYIALPTIGTTRAGFDFDIDKLYLIRRSFIGKETSIDNERVWNEIYKTNQDVQIALSLARKLATEKDIKAINEKYIKKTGKAPREGEIKLHDYWEAAQDKGYLSKDLDKKETFNKYFNQIKEVDKTVSITKFRTANVFDENSIIDYNKIFSSELSIEDINNLIFDIMLQRLGDPELAEASFSAGGFEQTSSDAKFVNIIKGLDAQDTKSLEEKGTRVYEETPNAVQSVYVPVKKLDLGFVETRDDVESLSEKEPDVDFADPETALEFNQLNQKAAKLIGIYANDSANYSIFRQAKTMRTNSNKVSAILFGSALKGSSVIDGYNMLIEKSNGKTIKQRIAELLAASVDAVKDPVLNFLNLDTITGEAATVLIRMGYDTRDVGLLFNQPIICEVLNYMKKTGENGVSNAMNYVLRTKGMLKENENIATKAKGRLGNYERKFLTQEALAYNLTKGALKDNDNYYKQSQMEVAKVFYNLMTIKDEYNNIVQITRNTSSNIVKPTLGEYYAKIAKNRAYINSLNESVKGPTILIELSDNVYGCGIEFYNGALDTAEERAIFFQKNQNNPFEFENVVFNLLYRAERNIINNNTPFNTAYFNDVFNLATKYCRYGTPTKDIYNGIMKESLFYMLEKENGDFNPSAVNPDIECLPLSLREDEDGNPITENNLTNAELYLLHIQDFINESTSDLPFSLLKGEITEVLDNNMVSRKVYGMTPNYHISREAKNKMIVDWFNLVKSDKPEDRRLAKALYLHLYYANSINNNSKFDASFTPSNLMVGAKLGNGGFNGLIARYGDDNTRMSYVDYMEGVTDGNYQKVDKDIIGNLSVANFISNLRPIDIIREYVRRHGENKQFIYHDNTDKFKDCKTKETVDGKEVERLTIGKDYFEFVIHDKNIPVLFIESNGVLYELNSELAEPKSDGNELHYTKVNNNSMNIDESFDNVVNFVNENNGAMFGFYSTKKVSKTIDDTFTDDSETSDDSSTNTNNNGFGLSQEQVNQKMEENNQCHSPR
jgi:hypothetical protein